MKPEDPQDYYRKMKIIKSSEEIMEDSRKSASVDIVEIISTMLSEEVNNSIKIQKEIQKIKIRDIKIQNILGK